MDDNGFLGPQHFDKPSTVVISRIHTEVMPQRDDDKSPPVKRAVMYFSHKGKEMELKYQVPKTVLCGLEIQYGTETNEWIGKEVELYKTNCASFGVTEECVRIRFSAAIEEKMMKKFKKKKINPRAYRIK